jgi:hypothetical protein
MNKTIVAVFALGVGGFLLWMIVKPKPAVMANPGRSTTAYNTATVPSQGGIVSGVLTLGSSLASAFSSYENNQTAQATYQQ